MPWVLDQQDVAKYWYEPGTGSFRGSPGLSSMLGIKPRLYSRDDYLSFVAECDRPNLVKVIDTAIACTSSYEIRYRLRGVDAIPIDVCETGRCHSTGAGRANTLLEAVVAIERREPMCESEAPRAEADSLTGLLSRHAFFARADRMLLGAGATELVLLNIDIDRFRLLNDTIGHRNGDIALREVGKRLAGAFLEDALVARSCADEFFVVAPCDVESGAQNAVEAAAAAFLEPIVIGELGYHLTASIGAGILHRDGETLDELLQSTDAALYDAKQYGGGTVCFATPDARITMTAAFSLELDLQHAIRDGELVVYYQPMFDFRSKRIIGAEALVRWTHPTRGFVMPYDFIPQAEHNAALMRRLGNWVLESVCAQLRAWKDAGVRLKVWVNTSPSQVHHKDFESDLCTRLFEHSVPPSSIGLELTERTFLSRRDEAVAALRNIREMGISIALDDFGVEYSSLAYTHLLPIDTIKIDRQFIKEIETNKYETSIVNAIVNIASELGLQVTAEGVETAGQHRALARMGCHSFQGNYFSPALAPEAFLEFLRGR